MGLIAAKVAHTPLEQNVKFTSREFDELANIDTGDTKLLDEPAKFIRLIGKFSYSTITRPGIAYSAQTLSQFLSKPKKKNHTMKLP